MEWSDSAVGAFAAQRVERGFCRVVEVNMDLDFAMEAKF
jgi:hypothetical protein